MDDAAELYRLMPDVEIVRRANALLLFSRSSGASVRVSPAAEPLLPLMTQGTTLAALEATLQQRHPLARDVRAKLQVFLQPLLRAGVLGTRDSSVRRRRGWAKFELFRPDPLASWLAQRVLALPQALRRSLLGFLPAAAAGGIVALVAHGRLPPASTLVNGFNLWGLLLFALVLVPVHELAHALACRMAGVEVGGGGILLHGGIVPGPYIETTQAYRVQGRWPRFLIPAAGPLVNLLGAGLAAWLLLFGVGPKPVLAMFFMLCVMFVYLDSNPFGPTDGARMLEALLDDELARRHAWVIKRLRERDRAVALRYRRVCVVHFATAALLLYLWLR